MDYADVCTGLSAPSVAWKKRGWKPVFFSEIAKFPCRVLKHHYPHVPNLGNMLSLLENEEFNATIFQLLVGGTPCQSFSIAGFRKGLVDQRGNLALQYCRILQRKKPKWFVWENVPGVLSSFSNAADRKGLAGFGPENAETITETADFATLIAAFQECGYSVAWRIFDAQFFGVPQQRKRLFVVGYFGNNWRPPAAVLFEPEGGGWNFAKSKKERKTVAGTLTASLGTSGGAGIDPGFLVAGTLMASTNGGFPGSDNCFNGYVIPCWWDGGQVSQTLDAVLSKGQMMPEKNRFPAVLSFHPQASASQGIQASEVVNTLGTTKVPAVVYSIMPMNSGKDYKALQANALQCLTTNGNHSGNQGGDYVVNQLGVRRITPLEAERLQGFPDNYTNIPGATDTPRYQALGNSMAVPVLEWIGARIDAVDMLLKSLPPVKQ